MSGSRRHFCAMVGPTSRRPTIKRSRRQLLVAKQGLYYHHNCITYALRHMLINGTSLFSVSA